MTQSVTRNIGQGKVLHSKGLSRRLIIYELRNIFGSWYVPFFGLVFPILMALLIAYGFLRDIPEAMRAEPVTGIALGFAQVIPMAGIFLGHAATYSNELESRIPLRMQLFGFSQGGIMQAKLISQMLFQTIASIAHFVILYFALDYSSPYLPHALVYFLILYLLGIIYFVLAHGIANFFRKFGPAYGVSMGMYFAFMILGGMMGIPVESLPAPLRAVSNLLPFTHLANEGIVTYWTGGSYNFAPLAQAMLFFAALAAAVLAGSVVYRRRRAY